jgi:RNA polymerase sigma-70 factor (ECF subfamily)
VDFFSFDDDYVRRLREGDRATEDHFAEYFKALLQSKLARQTRNVTEAADIRQTVFARSLDGIRKGALRDGTRLGSYVMGICKNVIYETFRRDSRTEPLPEGFDVPDDGQDLLAALVSREDVARVHEVLAEMPERDAAILRACFIDGRDKDEICTTFAIDRAYLRVLVHRAKERFRAAYLRKLN